MFIKGRLLALPCRRHHRSRSQSQHCSDQWVLFRCVLYWQHPSPGPPDQSWRPPAAWRWTKHEQMGARPGAERGGWCRWSGWNTPWQWRPCWCPHWSSSPSWCCCSHAPCRYRRWRRSTKGCLDADPAEVRSAWWPADRDSTTILKNSLRNFIHEKDRARFLDANPALFSRLDFSMFGWNSFS